METAQIGRAAANVAAAKHWCALAVTARDANAPAAIGVMPFALVDGAIGIVASRLAAHTDGLLAGRPVSVLFVDDGSTLDAYALPRLSIVVKARAEARGTPGGDAVWSALERRHGDTVALLAGLPDFEAFSLEPVTGRLILGFASAHDLDGETLAAALRAQASSSRPRTTGRNLPK